MCNGQEYILFPESGIHAVCLLSRPPHGIFPAEALLLYAVFSESRLASSSTRPEHIRRNRRDCGAGLVACATLMCMSGKTRCRRGPLAALLYRGGIGINERRGIGLCLHHELRAVFLSGCDLPTIGLSTALFHRESGALVFALVAYRELGRCARRRPPLFWYCPPRELLSLNKCSARFWWTSWSSPFLTMTRAHPPPSQHAWAFPRFIFVTSCF